MNRSLLVIIPIYGRADLAVACVRSVRDALGSQSAHVVLINDRGPESDEVERDVARELAGYSSDYELVTNDRNLGLVGSLNTFIGATFRAGTDILILNSDVLMTEGSIDEMRRVLGSDPMTGMVCPRSNNASIASVSAVRGLAPTETLPQFLAWSAANPESSVVPVAVGFCMMIRGELFDDFGLFDEIFSPGYGEENDFSYRIARSGWRVRLANRAFAFHVGRASFGTNRGELLQLRNEIIFRARYPRYTFDIERYLHATHHSDSGGPGWSPWFVAFLKQAVFTMLRPAPLWGARLVSAVRRGKLFRS